MLGTLGLELQGSLGICWACREQRRRLAVQIFLLGGLGASLSAIAGLRICSIAYPE